MKYILNITTDKGKTIFLNECQVIPDVGDKITRNNANYKVIDRRFTYDDTSVSVNVKVKKTR